MVNPNAEAGPSRLTRAQVESPPGSPLIAIDEDERAGGVTKNGLSVDENGEVSKLPAFLTKLFNMVSDPNTDELIYWSPTGDSFFVPNQEQFAKKILPKFFKHSNFSSFVRQLNMYAFHKVPHLNSSVLSNEAPQELWEFINPLFKKDQPDLLARIVRKQRLPNVPPPPVSAPRSSTRQAAQGLLSPGASSFPGNIKYITDGSTPGEIQSNMLVGPTGQQMVDLTALTSHIANIQRTQVTIAADLKALKASNEHLWREQLQATETQKRHQETIDLIVSFLERLFGTDGEGLKGLKDAMRRSGMARPREEGGEVEGVSTKRRRVGLDRMISDGREDENDHLVEISSDPVRYDDYNNFAMPKLNRGRSRPNASGTNSAASDWSSASQRFQTIPSEGEPSPLPTPNPTDQASLSSTAHVSPIPDLRPTNTNAIAPYTYPANPALQAPPLSPNSAATAAAAFNLDPSILQTTIGSLLQSPAAAQMFLNSLNNSVQGQALHSPRPNPPLPAGTAVQQSMQAGGYNRGNNGIGNSNGDADPTLALFSPLPHHEELLQHNDNLARTYQDAANMGEDVDKLQASINELVRSMGLEMPSEDGTGGLDHSGAGLNAGAFHGQGAGQAQGQTAGGGDGIQFKLENGGAGADDFELPEGFNIDDFLASLQNGDAEQIQGEQ